MPTKKEYSDENDDDSPEVVAAENAAKEAFERAIDHAEDYAKSILKECMEHAEESHFAHLNLLKKGASKMEPHLRKYLKDKSKKPRGSAENTFNTGLQRLAGGKYMAEHSGFEQTTGNGINTLLHFEKVAEVVENVYPEDNPLHQKIKTAFVGFRKVAELLYPFLTYTKS